MRYLLSRLGRATAAVTWTLITSQSAQSFPTPRQGIANRGGTLEKTRAPASKPTPSPVEYEAGRVGCSISGDFFRDWQVLAVVSFALTARASGLPAFVEDVVKHCFGVLRG